MDSFELLRTFREIATRHSFSSASKVLHISRASASKQIALLEKKFGVRLFNRSTRAVSLTEAGLLLLERSEPLLEHLETTVDQMTMRADRPSGRLQVTAPHGLGQSPLPPMLGEFMETYPEVHVSLRLSNLDIDLVAEGVDIAIRMGRIPDENVIVRRLRPMTLTLCATPRYWAKRGLPQKPDDIRQHDVLSYSLLGSSPHLLFQSDGETYSIPVHSRMDADDAGALINAALVDLGVICVPTVMVYAHVVRAALVPVLQAHLPNDLWLYAAYTQRRHNSAAIRTFLDFMESRIHDSSEFNSGF